ncbi:hypothetical protein GCM10027610_107530 [Dactylosporangium cerinum]
MTMTGERFAALWGSLSPIGRAGGDGGYLRHSWTDADLVCREWFVEEALDRDLEVEVDRNGNLWAWWGSPRATGRSSPAATSTRCRTAAAMTGRSASSPGCSPSTGSASAA